MKRNYEEWEILKKVSPEEYQKEFCNFMFAAINSCNCEYCPYGGLGFEGKPCGQQNCWVDAHCAALVDDDDEVADVGDYDDMEYEEDWRDE